MKNLIIIRHAKSSWNFSLPDIDRPLEQRGYKDAQLVSEFFMEFIPTNFLIYSSPARRARETAAIFAETFLYPKENIIYRMDLYTFDSYNFEKIIKTFSDSEDTIILFGHNEAITNFVNKFGDLYIDNVPTSGLTWLQFETKNWSQIEKGKIVQTIFPKKIK